jgi:hypothetical protein
MMQAREDIRSDKSDIRADYKAERLDGVNDQAQIALDKTNIRTERGDIAQDRSNIRTDERNMRQDRQDIRANEADLRNDHTVIAANQSNRGNGWDTQNAQTQRWQSSQQQDQHMPRNTVEPTKPALTSSTVANNAADTTRKTQTSQNLQKAWWHVW